MDNDAVAFLVKFIGEHKVRTIADYGDGSKELWKAIVAVNPGVKILCNDSGNSNVINFLNNIQTSGDKPDMILLRRDKDYDNIKEQITQIYKIFPDMVICGRYFDLQEVKNTVIICGYIFEKNVSFEKDIWYYRPPTRKADN